jgi:predicted metal-dependent phosphoesterase TrpH
MGRIDLHSHTDRSDGTEPPREVVRLAAEAGLEALAITDHDTTDGLVEARAAAAEHGLELITGCEISTQGPSGSVHILGYGFAEDDPALQALLLRIRGDRARRNAAMIEKLASLGMPMTLDEVERHAAGEIVARPHFVEAMLARGYVEGRQEAYEKWIGDQGPGYVVVEMPSPVDAIRAIREAGGASVLAHPRQLHLDSSGRLRDMVQELVDAGLDGLEVQHPSHKPAQRKRYRRLATDLDLVPTGGSDFHGAHKPHVAIGAGDGTIEVQSETWDLLRARIGSRTA